MTDQPWTGDACSLIDAFRDGERSPVEELEAVLGAIDASDLNAFCHLDAEAAFDIARSADVGLPFGGLPMAIKELEPVAGWPFTEASLVFRDRVSDHDSTMVTRLRSAGAVPVGATTASEFGGLNVSVTKINGVTHNPWRKGRTAGGSSGGSAAAVVGGLVTLATGGDGGGSIRIPAGYNGLVGMKGTYGRIPRGPHTMISPLTVVLGCLARSVRDVARYYDACSGYDSGDPTSLPRIDGWERGLGTRELAGRTVAVDPTLGGVAVDEQARQVVLDAADALIAELGLHRIDVDVTIPRLGTEWMMGNMATLFTELEEHWPGCADDLTDEVRVGAALSDSLYNLRVAASGEALRIAANDAMAAVFDQADFVITSTNPGPAFGAEDPMSSSASSFIDWAKGSSIARRGFGGVMRAARAASGIGPGLPGRLVRMGTSRFPELLDMGALTIPANITGNPAVSVPAGMVDGLPIGMQVIGRHHEDALLLDAALAFERARPWPLVAQPRSFTGVDTSA